MEDLTQLLLSQQAVFIYEVILFAGLVIAIVVLTRKRKLRKQIQTSAQVRQGERSFDDSFANQRRGEKAKE